MDGAVTVVQLIAVLTDYGRQETSGRLCHRRHNPANEVPSALDHILLLQMPHAHSLVLHRLSNAE